MNFKILLYILGPCSVILLVFFILHYIFKRLASVKTSPEPPDLRSVLEVSHSSIFTISDERKQNPNYAPVTSHLASTMTLADVLRNGEAGLNDSLGPSYYPKRPVSDVEDPMHTEEVTPSPMAPLQAPWPHLPPIDRAIKQASRGKLNAASSSLNNSFSEFLSNQMRPNLRRE